MKKGKQDRRAKPSGAKTRPSKILIYCGINNLVNFSKLRPLYDVCYGFDANPAKVDQARKMYADDRNAHFFFGALTEKGGEHVQFNITTDWDPSSTLGTLNPDYIHMKRGILVPQEKITVPTINLHDFCVEHGIMEIDTLITDLQGVDCSVIRTLLPFIREGRIRHIQCEAEPDDTPPLHLDLPSNKLGEFKKLLSENYDLVRIIPEVIPDDSWEMDVQWRLKGTEKARPGSNAAGNDGLSEKGEKKYREANRLFQGKKYLEACMAYGEATRLGYTSWEAFWGIARSAKELGRPELVKTACDMVLSINPSFAFASQLPKHARGYYSQLGQDEYIEVFFQKVAPRTKTFIEVGAFDGVNYSNVRRLHEKYGWTGVCIEPVQKNFEKLRSSYAGSTVSCIRAAISNTEGEMEMNVSTYLDLPDWGSDIASLHDGEIDNWSRQYSMTWSREKVPVTTLSTVLDKCSINDFDLLCVDTEGNDIYVLEGLDFERFRPSLVLVEYDRSKRDAFERFFSDRGYALAHDNGTDLFFAPARLLANSGAHSLADAGAPSPADITGTERIINVVYQHFNDQEQVFAHKNNTSIIWSSQPIDGCDVYAYIDAFSFRGRRQGTNVLLLLEPIVVLPGEYDEAIWKYFDKVFTFCDFFAENDDRFVKVLYPRSGGHDLKPITESRDERDRLYPLNGRFHSMCMINGNRSSHAPWELYSRRFQVAKWFSEKARMKLDLYGTPPFPLKNYIGQIPPDQKFLALSKYRFCLCFENTNHPVYSLGYLTEKMLDCFEARTIPVYLGAANIEKYVPSECFIDFRQFKDLEELDDFLHNMSDARYIRYIQAIDTWVTSGNLRRFSWHSVYDRLAELAGDAARHAASTPAEWDPGVARAHEDRKWQFAPSPVMWTWDYLHTRPSPFLSEQNGPDPGKEGGVARAPDKTGEKAPRGSKDRIKVLYAGLRYNYGNSRRGYDYGTLNMYDALKRFSNVEASLFDFVTEAQQKGVAGMSHALLDRVERERPDVLFYISYDESHDILHEVMSYITDHTSTQTIIWMSDDHWRFENYSRHWAPHAGYVVTTSKGAVDKYQAAGFGNKVIKSQWACNPHTYKPVPIPRIRDASFIGMAHGDRPAMIEMLRQGGLPVDVFGYGWGNNLDIPFYDMLRIFSESRININLSNASTVMTQQIKGRNFEVPGCRAFLLTTPAEDLESYYDIGREIIVASSIEEMIEKSKYYITHGSERENIAQRGYERTIAEHTWVSRFSDIFKHIGFRAVPLDERVPSPSPFLLTPAALMRDNECFIAKERAGGENTVFNDPENLSTIVVMSYNQLEYTRICIESILHYTTSPFELVLVDNGSTDGTFEYYQYIKDIHSHTRIIKNFENRIAEAVFNHAMSVSHGKHIVFVSNDTVVHENWLENFIDHMESAPDIGIVGPRSNSVSGSQVMEAEYRSLEEYHSFASALSKQNKGSRFEAERVVGMVSMMRKETLERVGGLDPELPTNGRDGGYGFSDNDFCIRLMTAGYRLIVANDVFVHHFGSVTVLSDRPDAFSTSQNVNKAKFDKLLSENPRIKKDINGNISLEPLSLSDPVDVPERYRIRTPFVCIACIGFEDLTGLALEGIPTQTRFKCEFKSFSPDSFHDWLQHADGPVKYDLIAWLPDGQHQAADAIASLIDTALLYPELAIVVPVQHHEENTAGPSGEISELSIVSDKDLSMGVLNTGILGRHLHLLRHFSDRQEGMRFLQRRARSEGYLTARANRVSFREPAAGEPAEAGAAHQLPERLLNQGKIEEAKKIYEHDVGIDPTFTGSFYQLAVIADMQSDKKAAIMYLERALEADEHHIPSYLFLSGTYMSLGNVSRAENLLLTASSKQPKNQKVIDALAELKGHRGSTAGTVITDLDKEVNDAFSAASKKVSEGDVRSAVALFEDLISEHPDLGVAYAGYGTVLFGKEDYGKARDVFLKAIELLPSETDLFLQLADTYMMLGEQGNSEEVLRKAFLIDPGNVNTISRLVDAFSGTGRLAEAVELVKDALQGDPVNPDLIAMFGYLAGLIGNSEALGTCIQKIREIDPSHPAVAKLGNMLDNNEGCPGKGRAVPDARDQRARQLSLSYIKLKNYSLKPAFLKDMQSIFQTHIFIETGTFMGDTALGASRLFRDVHTIELSDELFREAKARFLNVGNVHAYHGDSAAMLPGIIEKAGNERILFWLDGHYSGGNTAKTDKDTPVLDEIRAIARSGIKDPVIMVDDIRLFLEPDMIDRSRANGYPSLTEVCGLIKTIDEDYRCVVFGDVLIAYRGQEQLFSRIVHACTVSRLYDGTNYDETTLFQAEDIIRSARGDERSAIEALYSEFRSDSPDSSHYRLWFALTRMCEGAYQYAIPELLSAIGNGFDHWRLSLYLAEAYLKTGQVGQASAAIEKALEIAPESEYACKLNEIISQVSKETTGQDIQDGTGHGGTTPELTSMIIPVSRFDDDTRRCVESIGANAAGPCEIILAAAGPLPAPAWLKRFMAAHGRCKIISASKGANYAACLNEALKITVGQYILILDEHAVILKGMLENMRCLIDHDPGYGIAVPMSNRAIGTQQIPKTRQIPFKDFEELSKAFVERNRYRRTVIFEIDHICLLVKRSLIDSVGSFNEQIGAPYFTVNDYRIRALLEGYQTVLAGDSCMYLTGRDSLRKKGSDKVFHEQWDMFNPHSEKGKKLSPSVAMKNARDQYRKGLTRESVQAIMEGIQYTPEEEDLYYCLAGILLEEKLYDESASAIRSLSETALEKARALEMLGYCSYYLGRMEDADRYADRALSFSGDPVKALNLKGLLAMEQGDQAKAEALFRQAIAVDPGFADPYMNIGVLKWRNNDNEDALDLIEKGFILSPETGDFSTTYHSAVTSLNELSRAETVFMEACGLFPGNKKLSFLFIGILLQQEKYAEAMEAIECALLTFGADNEMLSAALAVREKTGPRIIGEKTSKTGTLSVCMIVKNEEKHIAKCLASLTPVADEIIVVDTGSTDRTKEISLAFGAQVFEFPWTNDFSEARNFSLEKAKGDWILVHDADEVLSTLDHENFIQILQKKHSRPVAYEITTRNYIMEPAIDGWTANRGEYQEEESGSGWFPSTKVRLFTNDRRVRFSNPVHEILEPSIMQAGIKMEHCGIPIHHYGKLPSETATKKADTYYLLGKQKLELMGNVPIALRELAIQAEELGKHEEAIEHWQAYARALPGKSLPYFNMATIYLEMNQFEQALNTSRMAYEIDPGKKETILTYATMSMCAGDPNEAVEKLEALVKSVEYPPAEVALAVGYCVAGRTDEGITSMARMKAKGYNYDLALHSLSKKLVSAGRTEQAVFLLDCMLKCNDTDPETKILLEEFTASLRDARTGCAAP